MPKSQLEIHVRRMLPSEESFVLSTWKHALRDTRRLQDWGMGLRDSNYWLLANFVIDKITLPSCEVWMGCHPSRPETSECWIAIRETPEGWRILHEYARAALKSDPELAAALRTALVSKLEETRGFAPAESFNPYKELKT